MIWAPLRWSPSRCSSWWRCSCCWSGLLPATARGGRELYAIGSDPDAAVLYGLPVRRRVFSAFVLCGALAGLAGVVFAGRALLGSVTLRRRAGLELQAVAAVVIGGVAIFGGSGTVWGAAIGAVLLVTINRALPIRRHPGVLAEGAVVGALILGSISLDRVLAQRRARALIEAEGRVIEPAPPHRDRSTPRPRAATYAAYARPLWQRLLLTAHAADGRAAGAGLRLRLQQGRSSTAS